MAPNNEHFNEDELEAPAWLNAQFLTEVLRKYEKAPELQVLELKTSPASVKGDHYASVMFRATVQYSSSRNANAKAKSLIIKTMPEKEGHKKEMLGDTHIFKTEIGMYTKVLPKFEAILREAGDQTVLCVPCIYHSVEPREVMIFEDLVPQGYAVVRDRAATLEELQCALSKLAKWHAISFKILQEDPAYFADFKYGLIEMPGIMDEPFMTTGLGNFIEMLEKVPELTQYKPYFEKFRSISLDRFKDILSEYRLNAQPNAYYVLSHGDFHLRNMMFKNNKTTGAFEDCMLLDFQISNICPIGVDVIYSIYMLMDPEQRDKHRDELLYYYFTNFVATLQKIGYKGELPNLIEFRRQLFEHRFFDIMMLTTFTPLIFAVKTGKIDIDDVIQKDDPRKRCFFIEEYIEDVKRILPRFLHQGYLE